MYGWFIYNPQWAISLYCVAPTVNEWLIRPLVVSKQEVRMTEPPYWDTHTQQTDAAAVHQKHATPFHDDHHGNMGTSLPCSVGDKAYSCGVYVCAGPLFCPLLFS